VLRTDLRKIYKHQGIQVDLWPPKLQPKRSRKLRELRGAYFHDDCGASVLIARGLPPEPMIFTLGHELKHHLADQAALNILCAAYNEGEPIEVGAQIFSSELIFPDDEFAAALEGMGVRPGSCTDESVIHLKHETKTTLSHGAMAKKATVLGYAPKGALDNVLWKKRDEEIYGPPIYKRMGRGR
jgi:Zn-dependent peptidase ImmA (M78 family)